jgi:hypothetical protein
VNEHGIVSFTSLYGNQLDPISFENGGAAGSKTCSFNTNRPGGPALTIAAEAYNLFNFANFNIDPLSRPSSSLRGTPNSVNATANVLQSCGCSVQKVHTTVELLVEAGFKPEEAFPDLYPEWSTLPEADTCIGSRAAGKLADIAIVKGDLAADIKNIENVEMVFKDGAGYDSKKLIESVKGRVGLRSVRLTRNRHRYSPGRTRFLYEFGNHGRFAYVGIFGSGSVFVRSK